MLLCLFDCVVVGEDYVGGMEGSLRAGGRDRNLFSPKKKNSLDIGGILGDIGDIGVLLLVGGRSYMAVNGWNGR